MADPERERPGPPAQRADAADGEIRAAGVVLWRPGDPRAGGSRSGGSRSGGPAAADVEVAVIHRPKYDDWSFAKGKLEPGEHVLRAAVRETAEETGLAVTLGRRLPHVSYSYRGASKRVDYWAATAADPSLPFTPNKEVDRLDWLPVTEALTRLSYQHDTELLAEFCAGPARTVPLIFLRHASAGDRSDWPGEDEARPLDVAGGADAEDLAGLLRCFGPIPVISSPAVRCLATVRPYAQAASVPVEADAVLAVAADDAPRFDDRTAGQRPGADGPGAQRPAADAAAGLAARLAAAGKPVLVCAHRENLPALLAAACAELGAPPPAGPPLRKAEFAVLHAADRKLVATERHQAGAGLAGVGPRSQPGRSPEKGRRPHPGKGAAHGEGSTGRSVSRSRRSARPVTGCR
jgi:8-oxo-(d)GTP phosphatase